VCYVSSVKLMLCEKSFRGERVRKFHGPSLNHLHFPSKSQTLILRMTEKLKLKLKHTGMKSMCCCLNCEINVLLPQLRSKPLDLTQEFDKILMQRRHALVHRRFSIFDPNNVEIKLSHLKQGRLAMEQANEVSIDLNSNHVQQKVEQYINYLKRPSRKNKLSETSDPECKSEEDKNENEGEVTEVADLLAPRKDLVDIDDEPSSDDDDGNDSNDDSANSEPWQSGYNGFTVVDEDLFPPHLFWSGCPLKLDG